MRAGARGRPASSCELEWLGEEAGGWEAWPQGCASLYSGSCISLSGIPPPRAAIVGSWRLRTGSEEEDRAGNEAPREEAY